MRYFIYTTLCCVGTNLVWHSFRPGTDVDEEDGGHWQFGFQNQTVSCRNVQGSVSVGALRQ